MTFSWLAIWQGLPYLLQGAGLTILISAVAMLLALILGMVKALLFQLPWRLLRWLTQAYVEIFRNTPLLIQIFIVYFGLPQLGLKLSTFLSGLSALVLYTAAYNTKIFRAGLEAVPKGQHEGRALRASLRFKRRPLSSFRKPCASPSPRSATTWFPS